MKGYTMPAMLLCLAAAIAGKPGLTQADDVSCPPNLGAVTIDGDVLVAAPCRLDGTQVKGNVKLYAGGSLVARNGVRIEGSIQAERSDFVDVADSFVNGNIQLDDLVGDRSVLARNSVGGSIQLKGNRSRLDVQSNRVNADVQAFSNTGGVEITDNTIDGNLQCKDNNPAPTGGNNRVQGNKEDQCRNLLPASTTPAPAPSPAPAPGTSTTSEKSGGSSSGGGSLDAWAVLALLLLAVAGRNLRHRERA
jgi:hypothetical protein